MSTIIINDLGQLYRLSEKKWRAYVRAKVNDPCTDIGDFGKPIGFIDTTITDWSDEDYRDALEQHHNQ